MRAFVDGFFEKLMRR